MRANLASWRDSAARQDILDFVAAVTDESGLDYVAPDDRLAVFDNDGTLWSEQPAYFQLLFAFDRLRDMAPDHPEWADDPVLTGAINGDLEAVAAAGMKGVLEIVSATHVGMTTDEFADTVSDWISDARHPTTSLRYTDMIFQPMLELLEYLRLNGFTTYIVSGGGIEFMRPWAESAYGIPPQQVIGSSGEAEYQMRDDGPVLVRLNKINHVDDEEGKPVGINRYIGRRPILAFGNSDGDHEMLLWTDAGDGLRFCGLVHHTDAEREWAYDMDSIMGGLDVALTDAGERGWTVVDMQADWSRIYPHESAVD